MWIESRCTVSTKAMSIEHCLRFYAFNIPNVRVLRINVLKMVWSGERAWKVSPPDRPWSRMGI